MRLFFVPIIILLISGSLFAEEVFEYNAKDKRDPFVSLVAGQGGYVSDAYAISGIKDVRLEGIVWEEGEKSAAIINGEIVEEGQEIGCVKILKIEKDAVIFFVDGEEVRVGLGSE